MHGVTQCVLSRILHKPNAVLHSLVVCNTAGERATPPGRDTKYNAYYNKYDVISDNNIASRASHDASDLSDRRATSP